MPELMLERDIYYMRDKLNLNVNEKKVQQKGMLGATSTTRGQHVGMG